MNLLLLSDATRRWILLLTSGLGLGILASVLLLPPVVFGACHGPHSKGGRAVAAMLATGIAFLATAMTCLYISFQLSSVIGLPRQLSFDCLLLLSSVGVAGPTVLVLCWAYDWESAYDTTLLKRVARSLGPRALIVVAVTGGLSFLIPTAAGFMIVVATVVILLPAGFAVSRARRPPVSRPPR